MPSPIRAAGAADAFPRDPQLAELQGLDVQPAVGGLGAEPQQFNAVPIILNSSDYLIDISHIK